MGKMEKEISKEISLKDIKKAENILELSNNIYKSFKFDNYQEDIKFFDEEKQGVSKKELKEIKNLEKNIIKSEYKKAFEFIYLNKKIAEKNFRNVLNECSEENFTEYSELFYCEIIDKDLEEISEKDINILKILREVEGDREEEIKTFLQ